MDTPQEFANTQHRTRTSSWLAGVSLAALVVFAHMPAAFAGGSGGSGGGGAGGGAGSSGAGGNGAQGSDNGNTGADGGNGSGFGGSPGGSGGLGGTPIFGGNGNGNGGGGGGGGTGHVATSSFTNSGTIVGGNGGNGANGIADYGSYGTAEGGGGGGGGSGVEAASGITINNSGLIQGGNGGAGGAGAGIFVINGGAGGGGAGIVGENLTVVNSGTIAGGVAGGGGARVDAITFTGGANTLTVGAGATFVGDIGINGNGTLTLDQSTGAQSISAPITGNGSVIKTGAGTVSLSGANSYAGGTTVDAGTLALGAGGSLLASGSVDLANAGATFDIGGSSAPQTIGSLSGVAGGGVNLGANILNFGDAGDRTFAGTIQGTGGIAKQGSGTQTFTGANTYSGGTTIDAGTLALGAGGSLSGTGTVNLAGSGTGFDIGGASSDQSIAGLAGVDGSNVTLGSRTLTFTDAPGTSFMGAISGAGGIALESGTQILGGANSFTGATTIDGGVLMVNGSLSSSSPVTVNSGGTLSGTGSVGTTTVNAGGTLAPVVDDVGNENLDVFGDLTLAAGSTYRIQVSSQAISNAITYGTVTLGGGTIVLDYTSASYIPKNSNGILWGESGVNGTFADVVNVNLPAAYTATVSYDSNMVNLDIEFSASSLMGSSPSLKQARIASALANSFEAAGGIPTVFGTLSPSQLHDVSGEVATGLQNVTVRVMDHFIDLMTDPGAFGRANRPQTRSPAANSPASVPWTAWIAGFGDRQTMHGDLATGSNDYSGTVYGLAAGAEYRVAPDTLFGFSLGGAGSSYELSNGLGKGSSNLVELGLYGRHDFGPAYLTGAVGYGWQEVTTDRFALSDRLQARFNATALSGRLEAGYRFATPFPVGLTPYAAAQFTSIALPAYSERPLAGSGLGALDYAARRATPWNTELGIRADTKVAVGESDLTIWGRLGWSRTFNRENTVLASFAGLAASDFVVDGAQVPRDAASTSLGAEIRLRNGLSLAAGFEGEFAHGATSFAGKGSLSYRW